MLLGETVLMLVAVVAAFARPTTGSKLFEACERALAGLAERRGLAILAVGLTALAARAVLLPVLPVPQPGFHDEFSYLLAADTFAHGRLTNPTHPMWIHFETFHVIQKPTYMSMYPPAQGVFLGLGQALTGHPFIGVMLSVAGMCAAICWMLQGWLPAAWALVGGLLVVLRLGTFSYWTNSYFGGAAAAMGGALALGALPRLKDQARVRDALLMGLGLAILANSRPYEGLVFSLPIAAALLVWVLRQRGPKVRRTIVRVIAPLTLALALAAAGTMYYFWRVTGNPFRMPMLVDRDTYAVAQYFPWQHPRPQPVYHHEMIKEFYVEWELPLFTKSQSVGAVCRGALGKLVQLWFFFLGPVLTLPVLMAALAAPYGFSWKDFDPGTRFLLIASLVSFLGLAVEVFFQVHYAAPMTCLIMALVLLAMRAVRDWRWHGKPVGLAMVRAVLPICLALVALRAAGPLLGLALPPTWPRTWCSPLNQELDRARVLSQLESYPGGQLCIVRYGPTHNLHEEWVYNRADIDGAKVVWARDMGAEQNQELIRYFQGRRVWLIEPDAKPPRVTSYPQAAQGG